MDAVSDGIDRWEARQSLEDLLDWGRRQTDERFGSAKNRRDSLSVLRKFMVFRAETYR